MITYRKLDCWGILWQLVVSCAQLAFPFPLQFISVVWLHITKINSTEGSLLAEQSRAMCVPGDPTSLPSGGGWFRAVMGPGPDNGIYFLLAHLLWQFQFCVFNTESAKNAGAQAHENIHVERWSISSLQRISRSVCGKWDVNANSA